MNESTSSYLALLILLILITSFIIYIHVRVVKKRKDDHTEKERFLSMFGSVIEAQNLGLVIWDKEDIVYINARIIAHLKDAQIDIRDRQQVRKLLENPDSNLLFYDVLGTIKEKANVDEDFTQVWTKEIEKKFIEVTYMRKNCIGLYYNIVTTRDISMEFSVIENKILNELINILSEEISKDNIDLKEIGEKIRTLLVQYSLVDIFAIALLEPNGEIYYPYFKYGDTDDRSGMRYSSERKNFTRYVIDKGMKTLIRDSKKNGELPDGYRVFTIYDKAFTDYGVPIIYRNISRGAVLFEKTGVDQFSESTISLFDKVASIITLALSFVDTLQEVQYERKRFFELSIKDYLTGAYSRRFLEQYLEKEMNKSKRTNRPISVVFIDIDKFKEINDKFGHVYGDVVLKTFVEVINRNIRAMDLIARYGGDEFILVFPETDITHAHNVMDRILESLSKEKISISFGIIDATAFDSIEEVYKEVDNRMYGMKRRNEGC
ncbi:MAG TPA: sensor domain-containing diguanylate cyclase [Fervidobacterium sp.]|nr:sensor domain-containing diguanylate cyclase [Fervidobacterium sp.]